MGFFKNCKIQTKLLLSFALLIAIATTGFSIALWGINSMKRATDDIALNWFPSSLNAETLKGLIQEDRSLVFQHILNTDDNAIASLDKLIADNRKDIDQSVEKMVKLISNEEEAQLVAKIKASLQDYILASEKALNFSRKNENEEAKHLADTEVSKLFTKLIDDTTKECELNTMYSGVSVASSNAAASRTTWLALGSVTLCIVFSIVICFTLVRMISAPLGRLSDFAKKISKGDLDVAIDIDSKDEVGQIAQNFREISTTIGGVVVELNTLVTAAKNGQLATRSNAARFQGAYAEVIEGLNATLDAIDAPLAEAIRVLDSVSNKDLRDRVTGEYKGSFETIKVSINKAVDDLSDALSRVAVGAEQVNAASSQIANGSQTLAQGASQQASALAEISSSMEQMSASTKQNADNSIVGKSLADEAKVSADKGNEAMRKMAESIQKIKESSDSTAKIVKTIDDIAFQTNLLALNAAVEAARAGDAGKGFAVVAEEVRNLAQRSAEAAKTTADLIEESVKNADGGVRITKEMSEILAQIANGSQKVNDVICEIAAASKQQASGIEQVNKLINNLDRLTQETAANSEESASAGEELNAQASSLASTVAEFQLVHNAQSGTQRPASGSRPSRSGSSAGGKAVSRKNTAKMSHASSVSSGSTKLLVPLDDSDFSGF